MSNVAHSGDNTPDYDIEATRFDSHDRTWASWTHTAFLRQAVACAIAVASYGGARYAAKKELREAHRNNRTVTGGSDPPAVGTIPVPTAED